MTHLSDKTQEEYHVCEHGAVHDKARVCITCLDEAMNSD